MGHCESRNSIEKGVLLWEKKWDGLGIEQQVYYQLRLTYYSKVGWYLGWLLSESDTSYTIKVCLHVGLA